MKRKALWLSSFAILMMFAVNPTLAQVEWGEMFDESNRPPVVSGKPVQPERATAPVGRTTKEQPTTGVQQVASIEKTNVQPPALRVDRPSHTTSAPQPAQPAQPPLPPPAPARHQVKKLPAAHPQSAPTTRETAEDPTVSRETALVSLSSLGLSAGLVIDSTNQDDHEALLTPGMQWATTRGWRIEVAEPSPIVAPAAYRAATEKYSGQTRLGGDGLSLENHVAGRPFPRIDSNDPDAVKKIMWNYYYNFYVIDDVVMRDFHPRTGTIAENGTLQVERAYVVESYRKLNYTARLYVEPTPELNNPERVRFKESVHPIVEPFDIKGVGFTAYRYLDPNKQDDSWLYVPQLRRVRRMSSAQRSDALFGQDTDADSYGGYNGHIAWMSYTLLGEQTLLAPMHARNCPVKWGTPHDWTIDEVWEPRRVWVIEAEPKLAQYAYGKRILFVDQEAFLIPLTDSYDRAGQLWKSQVNVYAQKMAESPQAVLSRYSEPMLFQLATVVMDAQLEHATTSSVPSELARRSDTFLLNQGSKGGTTEDYFTIAHMMASAK